MEFEEKTLSGEYIYKGKVLNLKKDLVELPDKTTSYREIVEHGGGAAVLCVSDGKVLMVKQFRYAYKEEIIEIPAGKIDKGETPEKAARRELEEEAGIVADEMTLISEIYPSPGYTNEKIYVYRAEGLKKGNPHTDKDEFLRAFWLPLKDAEKMCRNGEIKDSKTLIALSHLKDPK